MNGFFDIGSKQVGKLYASYQQSILGALVSILDGDKPESHMARAQFASYLMSAQATLLTTVSALLENMSRDVVTDAIERSKNADMLQYQRDLEEVIKEGAAGVLATIAGVAHRDAESVAKKLRDYAMLYSLKYESMTRSQAASSARIELGNSQAPVMQHIDAGGKRWSSETYVATEVRGFYVNAATEVYLKSLSMAGVDLVQVTHPDKEHKHNGLIFSISGTSTEFPSYYNIQPTVFHPNSRVSVDRA